MWNLHTNCFPWAKICLCFLMSLLSFISLHIKCPRYFTCSTFLISSHFMVKGEKNIFNMGNMTNYNRLFFELYMVPKYEENPSSDDGGMWRWTDKTDGQANGLTDRAHSYIPRFCYCIVGILSISRQFNIRKKNCFQFSYKNIIRILYDSN